MKTLKISGSILGLLILGGCATDPTNDPRTGGFFGGVHGLAAGDYEVRQQELQGQRDETLDELRALREEGSYLETERQMKAEEVAEQRHQLASLKAKNQALLNKINQLRRSKSITEQQTAELQRKQQRLTRDIQQFDAQLQQGQLSIQQAETRQLSLERQYDAIKGL